MPTDRPKSVLRETAVDADMISMAWQQARHRRSQVLFRFCAAGGPPAWHGGLGAAPRTMVPA